MPSQRNARNFQETTATVVGVQRIVAVGELRPNTWNYNRQREGTFNRLVAVIRRHGFTKPVIVRQTPTGLEIVDGEHRWRAAKLLGLQQVPIVDLGAIPDRHAKEMTVVLNELGGDADEARLGDLLRDVHVDASLDELVAIMPFTNAELEVYTQTIDFSFASLSRGDTRTAPEAVPEPQPEVAPPKVSRPSTTLDVSWDGSAATRVRELLGRFDAAPKDVLLSLLETYCKDAGS